MFEDLTHIRENIPEATWQHVWAFRRLSEYVEYKAKEQDINVVHVDPRNTSKRCSTCGFTHDHNRHGEDFECQDCGYQNHADYNAVVRLRLTGSKREAFATAKNIGLQYLRRPQKSPISGVRTRRVASRQRRQNADDGGAPVDVRLNRGTLNVSGEYVPPASAEA